MKSKYMRKYSFVSEVDSMILYSKVDVFSQKIKWKPADFEFTSLSKGIVEVGLLDVNDLHTNIPGIINIFGPAIIHRTPLYFYYHRSHHSRSDIQLPLTAKEVEKIKTLAPVTERYVIFYNKDKEVFVLHGEQILIIKKPNPVYDISEALDIVKKYDGVTIEADVFEVDGNFKNTLFKLIPKNLKLVTVPVKIELSRPWRWQNETYYMSVLCRQNKMVYGIKEQNYIILFQGGDHED